MDASQVKHTVKLDTNISSVCPYCTQWQEGRDIDVNINHLIQAHGGTVLHVGCESSMDDGNRPYHQTVAILGFKDIPPEKPPVKFVIERTVPGE